MSCNSDCMPVLLSESVPGQNRSSSKTCSARHQQPGEASRSAFPDDLKSCQSHTPCSGCYPLDPESPVVRCRLCIIGCICQNASENSNRQKKKRHSSPVCCACHKQHQHFNNADRNNSFERAGKEVTQHFGDPGSGNHCKGGQSQHIDQFGFLLFHMLIPSVFQTLYVCPACPLLIRLFCRRNLYVWFDTSYPHIMKSSIR